MSIFSVANKVLSFFEEDKDNGTFNIYSFADHSLIINGTEIKGFDQGNQVIRAEKRTNTFSDVVGIGGEMIAYKSADNTGVFSVLLGMKSPYNGFLSGLHLKQKMGAFSGIEIMFRSDQGGKVTGHRAYIVNSSTISRGDGNNAQEWVFVCENYNDLFNQLTRINGDGEEVNPSTRKKITYLFNYQNQNTYKFDGVITENEVNKSIITKHPVEFGANVTDHVFTEPTVYTISAIMTDTTLSDSEDEGNSSNGFLASNTSASLTRSQNAYEELKNIWSTGALLFAQTAMDEIDNLLITNITRDTDKDTAHGLFVNITFEQIIWTESVTTTLPAEKINPADRDKSGNKDKGNQQAEEVKNEENKKSWLLSMSEFLTE